MTTNKLEISRAGNEPLTGTVYLGQGRTEWPITVLLTREQAITFLKEKRGYVWEYEVTPVQHMVLYQPPATLEPDPFWRPEG